ncbi:hypothetical protein EWM64_g3331 [Hericium alpestre]|uniref:Uncharacterized protein n=1 Tax=Hericium alpestre TaxID=135208 RepID=A0A4Z0A472_9AGAM|nr:hypothetical protein EWM64_g3331 [Hericium alpestre]
MLTNPTFESAISTTLTNIRSEIKRKLAAAWMNKKDIYAVVQLIGKASMVPTAQMWGRWSWVQFKLVDYQEMVNKREAKDDLFWDWIDTQLKERHDKYQSMVLELPQRAVAISRVFELTLKKHITMFPAPIPVLQAMSPWQTEILKSIDELEKYSGQDLTSVSDSEGIDKESAIQALTEEIQLEEEYNEVAAT